jgi:hypothetical protein
MRVGDGLELRVAAGSDLEVLVELLNKRTQMAGANALLLEDRPPLLLAASPLGIAR